MNSSQIEKGIENYLTKYITNVEYINGELLKSSVVDNQQLSNNSFKLKKYLLNIINYLNQIESIRSLDNNLLTSYFDTATSDLVPIDNKELNHKLLFKINSSLSNEFDKVEYIL
jgi:hypothetical protein